MATDQPPSIVLDILAINLRFHMGRQRLSQAQLAKLSGVGQSAISTYMTPGYRPTPVTNGRPASASLVHVQALAQALGMNAWQLLRPPTKYRPKSPEDKAAEAVS